MERIHAPTDNPWRILEYVASEARLTGRRIFEPRELAAVDPQAITVLPMFALKYIGYDPQDEILGAITPSMRVWIWYPDSSSWISAARRLHVG